MSQNHAMRKYHFLIAVVVLFLDRLAKWTVELNIPLHDSISVLPGFLRFTHVQNRGSVGRDPAHVTHHHANTLAFEMEELGTG